MAGLGCSIRGDANGSGRESLSSRSSCLLWSRRRGASRTIDDISFHVVPKCSSGMGGIAAGSNPPALQRRSPGGWPRLNNRAENSHQPFRHREQAMRRFRSMKTPQSSARITRRSSRRGSVDRAAAARYSMESRVHATLSSLTPSAGGAWPRSAIWIRRQTGRSPNACGSWMTRPSAARRRSSRSRSRRPIQRPATLPRPTSRRSTPIPTTTLIDLKHAVIVDVEATTAICQAEVGAAKTMLDRTAEQFGCIHRARPHDGTMPGGEEAPIKARGPWCRVSGRSLNHQMMSLQAEPSLALEAPVDPAARGQRA